jgi:hypothetical protein
MSGTDVLREPTDGPKWMADRGLTAMSRHPFPESQRPQCNGQWTFAAALRGYSAMLYIGECAVQGRTSHQTELRSLVHADGLRTFSNRGLSLRYPHESGRDISRLAEPRRQGFCSDRALAKPRPALSQTAVCSPLLPPSATVGHRRIALCPCRALSFDVMVPLLQMSCG